MRLLSFFVLLTYSFVDTLYSVNREIGALSAQRLSDLIAAAIPSSVELGIMPLLVLTATAATAAGAAAAATAQWGEEADDAPASWRQRMHVGFRIDAMDTQRTWYEAILCDVRGANVCVHYRAWASRWDRWLPRASREISLPWTRVPSFRNFRQGPSFISFVCFVRLLIRCSSLSFVCFSPRRSRRVEEGEQSVVPRGGDPRASV